MRQQAVSVKVRSGSEIHFSVYDHRREKLNTVFGDITIVARLFCIVELDRQIRGGERVEYSGEVLESPYDPV